jgi:hypothetical protein
MQAETTGPPILTHCFQPGPTVIRPEVIQAYVCIPRHCCLSSFSDSQNYCGAPKEFSEEFYQTYTQIQSQLASILNVLFSFLLILSFSCWRPADGPWFSDCWEWRSNARTLGRLEECVHTWQSRAVCLEWHLWSGIPRYGEFCWYVRTLRIFFIKIFY